jgi:hypothetical protein
MDHHKNIKDRINSMAQSSILTNDDLDKIWTEEDSKLLNKLKNQQKENN